MIILFAKVEIPWPWRRWDKYPRKTAGTPASHQLSIAPAEYPQTNSHDQRWVRHDYRYQIWWLMTWAALDSWAISTGKRKSGNVYLYFQTSSSVCFAFYFGSAILYSRVLDFNFKDSDAVGSLLHAAIYWFRDSFESWPFFINPQSPKHRSI